MSVPLWNTNFPVNGDFWFYSVLVMLPYLKIFQDSLNPPTGLVSFFSSCLKNKNSHSDYWMCILAG